MTDRGRRQEHEIEIDASPEAVWKALTDNVELTRWYLEGAEVHPGSGKTRRIDWGGGQEMELVHDVWEPGKRLRMVPKLDPGEAGDGGAEDYLIEARGGRTVLRLVFSGIPEGEEWDSLYEGTEVGWAMFFVALRHYLECHPGKPRRTIYRYDTVPCSPEALWRHLTGAVLATHGGLEGRAAGDPYEVQTPSGAELRGRILISDPNRGLTMTLDEPEGSLLSLTLHRVEKGSYLNFIVSAYGIDDGEYRRLERRWQPLIEAAFSPS